VTPVERRTWSAWTMFGYWFSDALNAQSWMAPASIIALGLTWREAVVCIIVSVANIQSQPVDYNPSQG